MHAEGKTIHTRVWWDGGEVEFIRWTEKTLVFRWANNVDAPVHMPRGTVMRLLDKGVLRIEGPFPDWIPRAQQPLTRSEPNQGRSKPFDAITRLIRKLSGGERPAYLN